MRALISILLCNIIYKIIAKVWANRLKVVLPNFISQEQSAFIESRSILGNVMVAIETIHHMKCKRSGNTGEVALKIDIWEAYDIVSWMYV